MLSQVFARQLKTLAAKHFTITIREAVLVGMNKSVTTLEEMNCVTSVG